MLRLEGQGSQTSSMAESNASIGRNMSLSLNSTIGALKCLAMSRTHQGLRTVGPMHRHGPTWSRELLGAPKLLDPYPAKCLKLLLSVSHPCAHATHAASLRPD